MTTNFPIRIAFVVHTFDMAGLERCIAHFVNNLDHSRYQPLVVCLNRSGSASQWITRDNVPIIELHKRPQNDLRVIKRLASTLREHRVDVVQSHNWGTLLETTLACRRIKGIRHVHTEHGQELSAIHAHGVKRWLRTFAGRWALKRIDSVVAVAESVRERLRKEWDCPCLNIDFIPNGVCAPASPETPENRNNLRKSLGLSEDSFLIGTVGRLAPVKDFGNAIDAVVRLRSAGNPVDFVIVGDGPEKEALNARTRESGMTDHIHFIGYRDDINEWLHAFDVYVNSSLSEAMSMSILEAMAIGLPVIATNVGDSGFLINGKDPCGIVVPPADPISLADAISKLLLDKDQRHLLGEQGKKRHTNQYSLESMINGYEKLYLGNNSPPAQESTK